MEAQRAAETSPGTENQGLMGGLDDNSTTLGAGSSWPERSRLEQSMRRDRLAVLGVVVLLLVAVGAPQAFRKPHARSAMPLPDDGPPLRPSAAGEFRGISLQLHSFDPKIPFEQYVREIARTGANTVCLSLAAYQENTAASSLFIEYRKVPSVQRIEGLVHLAHKLGLRVVLMPIVLLENPGSGEWRGKIQPRDPTAWWEDYENYILFYARLAERTGAEVFLVGSELVSLEAETQRWRTLIRKVRRAYKGRLSYSANWDHYKSIQWWRDLDIIGMTTYHDLVGDKKPTLQVLLNSWKPIKRESLDWQRTVGRPIMFTEVGWPSQEGCAKEPWNYYGSTKPDLKTQAMCFEAFFRTWWKEKVVAGALLWEWRNNPGQVGGPEDISYVPCGKPAMQVIRKYFQAPGAWSGSPTRTRPGRG